MSEQNLDKLYRLIEQVLLNNEISLDDVLKTLSDTNSMLIALNGWCLSNIHDQVYAAVCNNSFKVLDEAMDILLKYLIVKFLEGKVKVEKDVLSKLYSIFLNIIDVIKDIIKNTIIIQEEKVLCKVLKPIAIAERIVGKGYIVLLPLDIAILLSALGYVEPIHVNINVKL